MTRLHAPPYGATLFVLLLLVFTPPTSAQTKPAVVITKPSVDCQRTATFDIKVTHRNVERSDLQARDHRRGQKTVRLCQNRGELTLTGRAKPTVELLRIEAFKLALSSVFGRHYRGFGPFVERAETGGATVKRLPDGSISVRYRQRDGGQWLVLIDTRRDQLLGASEWDYAGNLLRKYVTRYTNDGTRPPRLATLTETRFDPTTGNRLRERDLQFQLQQDRTLKHVN